MIGSPDLQVHDDLPLIHILWVNLDPVDPKGLCNNIGNHYGHSNTGGNHHNTANPTSTWLKQGRPRVETI